MFKCSYYSPYVQVEVLKKVPYTSESNFDNFAGRSRELCLIVCWCAFLEIYTYIYIYRERERERERDICVSVCVRVGVYACVWVNEIPHYEQYMAQGQFLSERKMFLNSPRKTKVKEPNLDNPKL